MSRHWIPLPLLFDHPEVRAVTVSPDGQRLAMIRPLDGVPNVWLAPVESPERVRPLTRIRGRGVRSYTWAYDGRHLLPVMDEKGDENWRIYATDIEDGHTRCLTPQQGVQAQLMAMSPHHPEEVVVGLNDRDPRWHDLYRINVRTGERRLLIRNDAGVSAYVMDEHLQPRIAQRFDEVGGGMFMALREGRWQPVLKWDVRHAHTIHPLVVRGRRFYYITTLGGGTGRLAVMDLDSLSERILASDAHYDVAVGADAALGEFFLFHPRAEAPEAVSVNRQQQEWMVLDPALRPVFDRIAGLEPGRQFGIVNRDLPNEKWIVLTDGDRQSPHYYLLDRRAGTARLLYRARPALEEYPLVVRQPLRIRSRDGWPLEGYVSFPEGKKRPPVIAYVHGGPWYRDSWGYEPLVQWLANRGFAVVQVNFRGSLGYGLPFLLASVKEWGGKMLDDVTDGVRHLVDQGQVDAARVGIMGGSFGGYSVLAGLAFASEHYRAGVDIVGPSNLFTFMESIPPYWEAYRSILYYFVGHPEQDRELLRARSPFFHVDRIRAPLLIGQGANDPRVKRTESIQIVTALRRRGHPVEYVEYPDEGHGFYRTENQLDFFGRSERFLLRHLG